MRQAVETLRLDYAQFLELEVFTRFGASLEPRVQAQIRRGERIRAVLAQPQYAPLPLDQQVALLLALQTGALDAVPLERIADFRAALPDWLQQEGKAVTGAVAAGDVLAPELRSHLAQKLATLAGRFAAPSTAQR
jgi:F-type H+-transporting ATPase subunit alpha